MKLSILICTLNEPFYIERLKRLQPELDRQIAQFPDQVLYSIHDAGRAMSTGQKRNELIQNTESDYFVFIDSDDMVVGDYVKTVLDALSSEPDCVTYRGWMTTNGTRRQTWRIKLGNQYVTKGDHHDRWPNHISVMRRDKVAHVKFPYLTKGEDYIWSESIHNKKLLKTEIHIDRELYWYDFDVLKGQPDPSRGRVKHTRL